MDVTWLEIIKLAVFGLLTWWIRHGSKADVKTEANRVITSTAAQSTSNEILERLAAVETDLALIKKATVKCVTIDDRAPIPNHK